MSSLQEYLDEWDLLTPEEKAYVSNGCGPKFGNLFKIVPDFCGLYTPACNIHDWLYWSGGPMAMKKKMDRKIKEDLKELNRPLTWYKRYALSWVPSTAYWFLSWDLSKISYHRALERRTRHDLRREMRNATV